MKKPRGRTFCRLYGAILIGAQALISASITPVSSCTIDGAPAACTTGNPDIAETLVLANTGLGTNFLSIEINASAGAGFHGNSSATASIEVDFIATTEGPVRFGFITYTFGVDSDAGFGGGAMASGSISGIGSCNSPPLCVKSGSLEPFQLGVPFEIKLMAFAAGNPPMPSGGSANAKMELQFFESDPSGNLIPVNVVEAPVPEPGTFGLGLLASAGLLWIRRLRR